MITTYLDVEREDGCHCLSIEWDRNGRIVSIDPDIPLTAEEWELARETYNHERAYETEPDD